MKKILFLIFSAGLLVAACTHKSAPVITDRTVEPPAPAKPAPKFVSKEAEAGYAIYTTQCIRCHNAKPVGQFTQEEWAPILKSMVRKAKLDSVETAQVTAFVNAYAKNSSSR